MPLLGYSSEDGSKTRSTGESDQVSRRLRFGGLGCSRALYECLGERTSGERLLAVLVVGFETSAASRFLFNGVANKPLASCVDQGEGAAYQIQEPPVLQCV